MTHQCRMGWAPLAQLLLRDEPTRPSRRTEVSPRMSEGEREARRAMDVPAKINGAAQEPRSESVRGLADPREAAASSRSAGSETPVAAPPSPEPLKAPASVGFKPGDRVRPNYFSPYWSEGVVDRCTDTHVHLTVTAGEWAGHQEFDLGESLQLITPNQSPDPKEKPAVAGDGIVPEVGKVYWTSDEWFKRWDGLLWSAGSCDAYMAAKNTGNSGYQKCRALRLATPAELRGEA